MDNYVDMIEELDEIREKLENIMIVNNEMITKCAEQDDLIDEVMEDIEKAKERYMILEEGEE